VTFALIEQRIDGTGQATFDFERPIGAYVYGIRKFCLTSGTPGAAMQDFGISYTPAYGTGVGYTQVTLQQKISAGMDPATTYAYVTVLAFLGGSTPQDVLLGNQQGMPLGVSGSQLVPNNPPAIGCPVLGGFSLVAQSTTADLDGIGVAVGMTCWPGDSGSTFSPVGTGELLGNSAVSGTIDIGHIIAGRAEPGIWLAAISLDSPNTTLAVPLAVPAGDTLAGAVVFVQSYYAQFDVSNPPIPDFVSLTVGADGVAVSGTTVSGSFQIDYQGLCQEVRSPSSEGSYVAQWPATVTLTVGSAVVVGIA
jgi:hypothetical protein